MPCLPFLSITHSDAPPPIIVQLTLGGKDITAELDTGSCVSAISEALFEQSFKSHPLLPTDLILKPYDGSSITPIGKLILPTSHNSQSGPHPFYVIRNGGQPLLGRDWLQKYKVNWANFHELKAEQTRSLNEILEKHSEVFKPEIGLLKGFTASLLVQDKVNPKFVNPRPVPFALKPKIEQELRRLQSQGILKPVDHSDWGTPIVPVLKKTGDVRICGDYKVTLNSQLKQQKYSTPPQ